MTPQRVSDEQLADYLTIPPMEGPSQDVALDLRDARKEIAGIRGHQPDVRLVRFSDGFLQWFGTRDDEGARLTAEWGEPDEFGVYNPIITRHADDSLGAQLTDAHARLKAWEPVVRAASIALRGIEDMGVYPAAVVEGGDEPKRVERTPWQEGWNQGHMDTCAALGGLVNAEDALPPEMRP